MFFCYRETIGARREGLLRLNEFESFFLSIGIVFAGQVEKQRFLDLAWCNLSEPFGF